MTGTIMTRIRCSRITVGESTRVRNGRASYTTRPSLDLKCLLFLCFPRLPSILRHTPPLHLQSFLPSWLLSQQLVGSLA